MEISAQYPLLENEVEALRMLWHGQTEASEGDVILVNLEQIELSAKQLAKQRDDAVMDKSKFENMIHECVSRLLHRVEEEGEGESERSVYEMVMKADLRLQDYVEMRRKEKRELENSVASLTEENRDMSSLLRIALVEKERVERSLSRLKGEKPALLQFAERGLQKVGFGFMTTLGEVSDDSCASECEEEVASMASTVENMMKNLRLEIAQLKQSLEEVRSDNERLQNLSEKQTTKIQECTSYIHDLEEKESRLAQNIEQLVMKITGSREEGERWREACELEVEAGKHAIAEHERETMVLREELVYKNALIDKLNRKLKMKEKLAAAAMAAEEAAHKSLQIADRRGAELNQRIEELTRQLEVADERGRQNVQLKLRHICWPWRALRVNPGGRRNGRRMVPEMRHLL